MLIDNKKTREISWNDFELSGNKENLINQGWESFEPYGSGKNYVENWNFNEDMESWGGHPKSESNTVEVGYQWKCRQDISVPQGQYVVRAKFRKVMGDSPRARIAFAGKFNRDFPTTDEWDVREFEVDIDDESKTKLYLLEGAGDGTVEFDWVQITPVDNQHLVVEKTPLENGLTRIQTWGGEHDMKFKSPNFGQLAETGTDMTISLYVENNSDSMIRFSNNLAIGGEPYPDGAKYMITVPREYKGFVYLKGEQVGRDVELDIRSDGNIDMIVSQPEIIEGHDLNAMLFMDELEDGRTHVRVFNPNQNTKLVYTGDKGIVGSPYTLSTEIENDGIPFKIKTSLTDDITVNEGINVINKSGELKEEDIKIEIGVD